MAGFVNQQMSDYCVKHKMVSIIIRMQRQNLHNVNNNKVTPFKKSHSKIKYKSGLMYSHVLARKD